MKTKGALLWELNSPFKVDEIDVGDPVHDEVQIRLHAAGMCHSDYHLVNANTPIALPALGGHEGAGVVTNVGKGVTGTCVVTGMGAMNDVDVKLNLFLSTMLQKTLKDNIFGGGSSHVETPRLVGLYKSGLLKIDEMVTSTYRLEDINDGYRDMLDGHNIRGVIRYDEADW